MCARDPMAVMDAFSLHIRLRLPRLFGQRACLDCPRCNNRECRFPCQNRFGSVMRATGGFLGGSPAYGSAVEHQGSGTPHVHGEIHLCCVHQYMMLTEIRDLVERDLLDPQSIMDFNSWLHCEEPPDLDTYEQLLPRVDEMFHTRFAGKEHDDMSQMPKYLAQDTASTMWMDKSISREQARVEGSSFKQKYLRDAQRIFSRVQHHFHERTKTGYKPLAACLQSIQEEVQTRLSNGQAHQLEKACHMSWKRQDIWCSYKRQTQPTGTDIRQTCVSLAERCCDCSRSL